MRLIDADKIEYDRMVCPVGNGMYVDTYTVDKGDIDNMPTIDAVPVIRCKDCKYYEPDLYANPWGVCCHLGWIVNDTGNEVDENGYCYRGERRDDNDQQG